MTKRKWYLRRLRSMSPQELAERSLDNARVATEWMRWRMGGHVLGEQDLIRRLRHVYRSQKSVWATLLGEYCRDGPAPLFLSHHDRVVRVDWLRTHHPERIDAVIEKADKIRAGEVALFGRTFNLNFSDSQVWMRDPVTENLWPRKHWAAVDHRDGRTVGGCKWVWELNRHAHLITLAKAFFLTDDETYVQEARRQLISWIGANPPLTGINWTSSLEIALRLIAWTWVLAFISESHALDEDLFRAINRSIYQQIQAIRQRLSTHSSANNHLIGEATGLVVCGISFPWFRDSEDWIQTGRAILIREARRQFHPDGVGAEQALAYQRFDMEMYMVAGLLLQGAELPFPQETTGRLEKACQFLQALADEEGNLPDIGDRDDSRAFPLDDRSGTISFPELLNLAAVTLAREDWGPPTSDFDETLYWLTGRHKASAKTEAARPPVPAPKSQAFPWGGYYVSREADEFVATFDCGPLGYLSTAAHGHADSLSVTLRAHGRSLLIDPGTYAYHEAPAWRDFFRGTRAHNTVTVDGEDQSESGGPFLWSNHAQTQCHRWVTTDAYDYVDGSHNGYASINVTHRRQLIYLRPDTLVVIDDITGKGDHHASQIWHFAPGTEIYARPLQAHQVVAEVEIGDDGSLRMEGRRAGSILVEPTSTIRDEDVWLSLTPLAASAVDARLTWGWLARIQGWVAPTYGHKVAAPVLSYNLRGDAPLRLISILQVRKSQTLPEFTPPTEVLERARKILAEVEREGS